MPRTAPFLIAFLSVLPKTSSQDCRCSTAYLIVSFPPVNPIWYLHCSWHGPSAWHSNLDTSHIHNVEQNVIHRNTQTGWFCLDKFQNKQSSNIASDLRILVPLGRKEGMVIDSEHQGSSGELRMSYVLICGGNVCGWSVMIIRQCIYVLCI